MKHILIHGLIDILCSFLTAIDIINFLECTNGETRKYIYKNIKIDTWITNLFYSSKLKLFKNMKLRLCPGKKTVLDNDLKNCNLPHPPPLARKLGS